MKRSPILIAILLLSLLLFSCELFIEEPQAGKVYAIFVALDYKNTNKQSSLDGTIPDANEQYSAFEAITDRIGVSFSGYQFIQQGVAVTSPENHEIAGLSINKYPSSKNIEDAFEALGMITKEEDLVIFTFSGHSSGRVIALASQVNDGPTENYEVSQLLDHLAPLKGRKLVILDACETGLAIPIDPASSSTLLENSIATWYAKYFSNNRSTKNDLFVMSSSAATDSYEVKVGDHYHGDFTQALLKGLGWDPASNKMTVQTLPAAKGNRLTVDGLLTYIKKNQVFPIKRTLRNPISTFQHPMVTGGALDMVLFTF